MEKYGFVYIWLDRKRQRYYIGSHWGTEDDGYICSSPWMSSVYKRRPEDFKRRILKRITSSRSDLLEAEYGYLTMIKDEEIGTKYYNLNIKSTGHWVAYPEKVKTIKEKISHRTKEAMARPEVREKLDRQYDSIRGKKQPEELVEKRRQSMIQTMAEKFPVENRYTPLTEEEKFQYYSQKGKDIWANRSEEQLREVRSKISKGQIGKSKTGVGVRVNGIDYTSITEASLRTGVTPAIMRHRLKSHKYTEYIRI